jgi:hypothetical protein
MIGRLIQHNVQPEYASDACCSQAALEDAELGDATKLPLFANQPQQ